MCAKDLQIILDFCGSPQNDAVERVKGIEPSSVAWEATALPLSYTRTGPEVYAPAPSRRNATHRCQGGIGAWPGLQKLPPRVRNTPLSLPPLWPTLVRAPISACTPPHCMRAPTATVP